MAIQIDAKAKVIMLFSQLANINFNCLVSKAELIANSDRIKTIIESDNAASKKINELWNCNWAVAWGPVLNYSEKIVKAEVKYLANNSMYIVKGIDTATNKHLYVVAIAGTNSKSVFEMFYEDIDVKKVKPWHSNLPEQGHLSSGSMTGLNKVLDKFKYGSNKTLMAFFDAEVKEVGAKNMEIITCGHSLGGALSPLVALKLKETYKDIAVSTHPTAGPTSGDAAFAKYAADALGAGNYISVINTNDIVPMAWEYDTFSKIPGIYDNDNFQHITLHEDNKQEKSILNFLSEYAKATQILNYTRISKETEQTFEGQPESPGSIKSFEDEALYQHLNVYMMEAFKDDPAFIEDFKKVLHPNEAQ